jgi:hypothetical protein
VNILEDPHSIMLIESVSKGLYLVKRLDNKAGLTSLLIIALLYWLENPKAVPAPEVIGLDKKLESVMGYLEVECSIVDVCNL